MQDHTQSKRQTDARARAKNELLTWLRESVDEWTQEIFEDNRARGLVPTLSVFMKKVMKRLSGELQTLFPDPVGNAPMSEELRVIRGLGLKNKRELERRALDAYYRQLGLTEPSRDAASLAASAQNRDALEMERLLRQAPSETVKASLVSLTDIERKVARLRWQFDWPMTKIARAMGKHHSTIAETLERAKMKADSHGAIKKASTASTRYATRYAEKESVEDKLIRNADALTHKDKK